MIGINVGFILLGFTVSLCTIYSFKKIRSRYRKRVELIDELDEIILARPLDLKRYYAKINEINGHFSKRL